MSAEPIAELEWDSAFFGFPIARVTRGDLSPRQLDIALAASRERGVRCLYMLVEATDERTSLLAQERGFRLYDIRVELDCALDCAGALPNVAIGPARPDQRAALELCARERIVASRFFADPRFDDERVRDLFAAFLERGFRTEDRRTLTDIDAQGFVTCRLQPERGLGTVELIGVASDAERTGLAAALMHAAHREFVAAGLTHAEVVTQGRNVSAQRLYQRLGYRTRRVGLWFHRWFD